MPMIVIHPVLSLYDEEDSIVWSSLHLTIDLLRSGYEFPATLLIVSTFVVPIAKFIVGALVVFSDLRDNEYALLSRILQAMASYQLLDVMVACIVLALCAQGSVEADPGWGLYFYVSYCILSVLALPHTVKRIAIIGHHDLMVNVTLALGFMSAALFQPLLELRIQHRGIALDRSRPSIIGIIMRLAGKSPVVAAMFGITVVAAPVAYAGALAIGTK
jgi:uncharacterized paraquat-inducible protein A